MSVIAPFLLSNSHLAADTVTGNDDLGVRPGRSRSHSNSRRGRGGFPDGRARSGRTFGRSPDERSRNTAPTGTWSQRDRQGTCGPPDAVAWRAASHIGYLPSDEVTRDGSPGKLFDAAGDEAGGRAFAERWTRLPAPGSGKAESVVDL